MPAPRRVILISGHYLGSKRRAGFHHLAGAFWNLGWDVTFVTVGISYLSWLKGDFRFAYPVREEANRLVQEHERLTSFVLLTPTHPGNLGSAVANRLSTPFFARYGRVSLGPLAELLPQADLVIFESTAGLLLVAQVRELAPNARLVYRASDDLRLLGVHPVIVEAETEAIPLFDLVSAPTEQIADVLGEHAEVHPAGIDKEAFDRPTPSPYDRDPSAVFAGVSHFFDYETLEAAAGVAPDVAFHVIGPPPRPLPKNVVFHPEMPFESVVPYLQHATFGLLLFPRNDPRLGHGNKISQYSYCRLPIVAPGDLQANRPNIVVFERDSPESLRRALEEAGRMPHSAAFAEGVVSSEELALILAGNAPARESA
jgi:2-beta-glucuronyltransferase